MMSRVRENQSTSVILAATRSSAMRKVNQGVISQGLGTRNGRELAFLDDSRAFVVSKGDLIVIFFFMEDLSRFFSLNDYVR